MHEPQPKELSTGQVAVLESLLKAGFRFVTFERYARYVGVERDGFVALLETGEGKVKLFGQVGYHVGEGIAMLVERAEGKAFVWKGDPWPPRRNCWLLTSDLSLICGDCCTARRRKAVGRKQ